MTGIPWLMHFGSASSSHGLTFRNCYASRHSSTKNDEAPGDKSDHNRRFDEKQEIIRSADHGAMRLYYQAMELHRGLPFVLYVVLIA
jgi:hypothetical protein